MKRNKSYNTKQKDLILDILKCEEKDLTIKDIYNELNEQVGLTTIYRFVDKLVSDGAISKTIGQDNVTYYRYLEKCNHTNHFYLKCENCGNMIHIDCDCIEDLSNHILKEHQFTLNHENIIINGICRNCLNKG